jgi:3',5'-cyclic AMP phosphodiesterase CpdA
MSFFFMQLADPQFGMYAQLSRMDDDEIARVEGMGLKLPYAPETYGLDYETDRYCQAIAAANRLRPDFVVTCGDMCNNMVDPADELAELKRITATLDPNIPMYWVAGNHDVTDEPTRESIANYRERFGPDCYSFDRKGSHFVVLNSTVWKEPINVPDELDAQIEFLRSDLQGARDAGADNIVLFTHHPPFLTHVDEGDNWLVLPRERRRILVDMLKEYGVATVFCGHWHRNHTAFFGDLQVVVTAATGLPLGDDPSGLRLVTVGPGGIMHRFYAFDEMPTEFRPGMDS